ncbi:hypothetical protein D3C75_449780 [compost metagenome]
MVVTIPDVSIFGVQIRPGFWPFKNHLIIVVMDVANGIDGTNRLGLTFNLFLMQENFVRLQAAVALLNIYIATEHCVVRIISFCVIGIYSDRQVVGVALN